MVGKHLSADERRLLMVGKIPRRGAENAEILQSERVLRELCASAWKNDPVDFQCLEGNGYIRKAELNGKPLNNCWSIIRISPRAARWNSGSDLSPTKHGEPIIRIDDRQRELNIRRF
jgi:hypothetical protein